MTSIFEGEPPKTRPFSKTRVGGIVGTMNFITHILCEIKTSGDVNPNDILYTLPETNSQSTWK